ncbi:unnamed protein product [Ilex paraguariensis]|uniref:E2 ubiquitin-conjugating enzyme n=1 Tax=Ilex paraguariensis TaxID=185542 RepID=A0ABC8UPV0_9AQUA
MRSDVIDVDMDEDCGDVMLIDMTTGTNCKGKESLINLSLGPSTAENLGSVIGVQTSSQSCAPGSCSSINLDGFSPDLSFGDDECMDIFCDDLTYDDEYAMLQSHFDSIDIPPGIEVPIPWFPENTKQPATTGCSTQSTEPFQWDVMGLPPGTDSSHSSCPPGSAKIRQKSTSKGSSGFRILVDAVSDPSPWSYVEPAQSKKKGAASLSSTTLSLLPQRGAVDLPTGVEPLKSWCFTEPSHSKGKSAVPGSRTHYRSRCPFQPIGGSLFTKSSKKLAGIDSIDSLTYSISHAPMDAMSLAPGIGAPISMLQDFPVSKKKSHMSALHHQSYINQSNAVQYLPGEEAFPPWVHDPVKSQTTAGSAGSSEIRQNYGNEVDILEKFSLFKKFDTVQDHLDHHYSRNGSSLKQPSKNWAKKIQEEWKILEQDLPDTIFVRVYESRMDLLRAVIVGAEGTPYHDGLFFFDVFFPSSYPDVPPHVYYHSGGLRINPNLYDSGKVCLSLLNTWTGNQKEKWIPGLSTMLQVLVSIQGLILNAKPYFNEPGYAMMSGSESGEKSSLVYNENTFILSLKTMVYTMRRPPKYFEDFVVGHFRKYGQDILVACKAYMEGAQVGCLVKGGVQDVDEGDKSCSEHFKRSLAGYINTLVSAFTQIGAKDCEKFLSLAQKGNRPGTAPPNPANYLSY